VHLHDDCRLGWRLVVRLPERGLDLEPVYRFDRQEPQRSAGNACMSSGRPSGGRAASHSTLAAIWAMLIEP
jgi:hypothetical protein